MPGLLTVFFTADEPVTRLRRRAGLRPRGLRAPGAARCWPAASTRRRRSSRPGSPRSPTRGEHVERTLEAAAAAFAEIAMSGALRRLAAGGAGRGRPARRRGGPAAPPGLTRRCGDARGRGPARRGPPRGRTRFVVEAIREGYLLHYGAGRVVRHGGPRPRAAGRRPPLRAGPRPPGRARRPRGRRRAGRRHRAVRAGPRRRDPELADAAWEAGAAAVGWGGDRWRPRSPPRARRSRRRGPARRGAPVR